MSDLTYAYAVNQWKLSPTSFVRFEHHERVFKSLSALGIRSIELFAGTGRWSNLGRPEHLYLNYGSSAGFLDRLHAYGIDAVSGMTWDPSLPAFEENLALRSTSRTEDHEGIVEAATPYLELLRDLGASHLIVRATESAWKLGDRADLGAVAAVLNLLGARAADFGIRIAARADCLSAVHGREAIDRLAENTDPALVDLSVGTADLVVAGVDPIDLIRTYGSRVGHVHLKDTRFVDTGSEYLMRDAEVAMLQGSAGRRIERWFYELGTEGGLVDASAVVAALRDVGYSGWVVVESDQSPHPFETAMLNAWTVHQLQKAAR